MPPPDVTSELPDGVFFADGSFARKSMPRSLCVQANPAASPVAIRDVVIDDERGLWARIFLPAAAEGKLPVLFYFHGGGFVCFTADSIAFHVLCESIAAKVGAVVISVNYRLAPENRLPAAYEDGFSALKWLAKESGGRKDPWMVKHADLFKVVVMGDSSGANLAHNIAVRAARRDEGEELGYEIAGMVLIQPFFGSSARLPSETKPQSPTALLSTDLCDRFWELALPIGASRDHPFCRIVALGSEALLPKMLVVAGEDDVLCDRAAEYVEAVKGCVSPKMLLLEETGHAFYVVPESKETVKLLDEITSFVRNIRI